jgi:hypothetical protein
MYINGLAEMPVQDISLQDMYFEAENGITMKNAQNIELHQVRINTTRGSAVTATNVQRLELDGVSTTKPIAGKPVLQLTDVQDAWIHGCWPVAGTDLFLQVKGAACKNVIISHNELSNATRGTDIATEAKEAVKEK